MTRFAKKLPSRAQHNLVLYILALRHLVTAPVADVKGHRVYLGSLINECLTLGGFSLVNEGFIGKQEIRSVELGICRIAEFTSPKLNCAAILAIR